MRITAIAIAAVLACACGNGGSKDPGPPPPPPPAICAPGSLHGPGGACVVVITQPKIDAVRAQQTRIDELGAMLDKLDALSAPIELLDGIRQLDAWKSIAATSDKLKVVDTVVQTLADSVKQLRAFRGNLGELSQRLGNLRGELDKLIAGTGLATSVDDARAQISAQVRALIAPYAQQTSDTIQRAVAPLVAQLADVGDLMRGACAMAKLSGGGDQLKDLCAKVNDTFQQAVAFVDSIKTRPAAVFDELTNQLVGQLDRLIDDGTKTAIAAAQKQVDAALFAPSPPAPPAPPPVTPPIGSGSGSAAGSAH